jgi:hypothetical protein
MEILEAPCRRLVAGHCCAEERAPRRVPRYGNRASTVTVAAVLACESARSVVRLSIHVQSVESRAVQLRRSTAGNGCRKCSTGSGSSEQQRGRVLALAELWEAHRATRQPSSSPGPLLRHASASFSHAHVAPCRLRSSTWSSWAQLALECPIGSPPLVAADGRMLCC